MSVKSDSLNFPTDRNILINSRILVFPMLFSPIKKFTFLSNLIVFPDKFL